MTLPSSASFLSSSPFTAPFFGTIQDPSDAAVSARSPRVSCTRCLAPRRSCLGFAISSSDSISTSQRFFLRGTVFSKEPLSSCPSNLYCWPSSTGAASLSPSVSEHWMSITFFLKRHLRRNWWFFFALHCVFTSSPIKRRARLPATPLFLLRLRFPSRK
jgi:hypothetical protein